MSIKSIAVISFLLGHVFFVQASEGSSVLSKGWSTPDILKNTNPENTITPIIIPAMIPRDLRLGNEQAPSNCFSVEGSTPGAVITQGSRQGQSLSEDVVTVGFSREAFQAASEYGTDFDTIEMIFQGAGDDTVNGRAKEEAVVQNAISHEQRRSCCCWKK